MQVVNASNWSSVAVGNMVHFSPSTKILDLMKSGSKFWLDTYGGFAGVTFDKSIGKIKAVRDHFGFEPFFYHYVNDTFTFASNIPDILKTCKSEAAINASHVKAILVDCTIAKTPYSDETCYQNIYRIEPGCVVEFKNTKISKTCYWDLALDAPEIIYKDQRDYIDHFASLLNEAVIFDIAQDDKIASEISGGVDSSAVIAALSNSGIKPGVFSHVAIKSGGKMWRDDIELVQDVVKAFDLTQVYLDNAANFDVRKVTKLCSDKLAGMANYIFPICANNIHKAVTDNGYNVLFSGFGGDECASAHVPMYIAANTYLGSHKLKDMWHEFALRSELLGELPTGSVSRIVTLLKGLFPGGVNFASATKHCYRNAKFRLHGFPPPTTLAYYASQRHREKALLQGVNSHHVRMRIEDSAIMARAMGFKYVYPLLYPKLVDFCFRLPITQKRRDGTARFLIRQYLARYLPKRVYMHQDKSSGGIMPATMEKLQRMYDNHELDEEFSHLPFAKDLNWICGQGIQRYRRDYDKSLMLYGLKLFMNEQGLKV